MDPTPSIEKVSAVRHLYPRPASKRSEDRGGKQTMGLKFIHCFSDRFPFPYLVFGKRNVFFEIFFSFALSLPAEASLAAPVQVRKLTFFTFHISWPMTSAELLLVVLFLLCKEKSTFQDASASNIFLHFKFFATHALDFPKCVPFFSFRLTGVSAPIPEVSLGSLVAV